MIIEKGNYISRIWFFYQPDNDAGFDVLGHLWRRLPDGPWRLEYRFRYHVDDKAHGSQDRKSGYSGAFGGNLSEAEVLEKVQFAWDTLLSFLPEGFLLDVTEIQTDEPREVLCLISQKPYMHMKLEETPP